LEIVRGSLTRRGVERHRGTLRRGGGRLEELAAREQRTEVRGQPREGARIRGKETRDFTLEASEGAWCW
jgi:hypothetical protein